MKTKTIVFTGHKCSAALLAFGKSIGAQFRNGHLAEDTKEPCDFVAGSPIPKSYSDIEVHPDWEEFEETGAIKGKPGPEIEGDGSGETLPPADNTEKVDGDDVDEIEVTAEYLEKLTKKQMLELVEEEELEFTSDQKKNAASLLAALKAHYEV